MYHNIKSKIWQSLLNLPKEYTSEYTCKRETRVHSWRPQNQLECPWLGRVGGPTLLPAFPKLPQQNGRGQGPKKPGDPGASHCCWGAILGAGKEIGSKNFYPWEFWNLSLATRVVTQLLWVTLNLSVINLQLRDPQWRHLDVSGNSNSWGFQWLGNFIMFVSVTQSIG